MRTWEENKTTINQLWPQCRWTGEEGELWRGDLSRLDQDVLYDAIRDVKRSHDTLYPQLKWMLETYRELAALKKSAGVTKTKAEVKIKLDINEEENAKLVDDCMKMIDESTRADFPSVEETVLNQLKQKNGIYASAAVRLLRYARRRLLGQEETFGRVAMDGRIEPISLGVDK